MSPEPTATASVDITPHPRILTVLKDIDLTMLQCFCELIDNSIDGFLDVHRSGSPIQEPVINLGIGRETISIHDNGPGMSLERLEHAIRAGWTSKDGTSSLGLYGMGFNVATAKLGAVTTIWTTRVGDLEWQGVHIDLAALAQGSSYTLPVKTRRKNDATQSGTEIEISNVKAEWATKLTPQAIRNNVTSPLGRIYKSMLREEHAHPIHFKLRVNGTNIPAWNHCVWPETKTVLRKQSGEVLHAVEEFDQVFNTRYRSRSTGDVFDTPDGHVADDLIEFQERVHGWIGVQRYFDPTNYGIDIIRNGRVIEMASKDLFYWIEEDGTKRKEYPIDEKRERGRIVGEIHLDHGYVFYNKKQFEHDHYSWHQLMQTVLDNAPLTKRDDKSPNKSPLGKVFRAFRRGGPESGGTYSEVLIIKDNEKAKLGAEAYRKGDPVYQSITWWDEQLAASDRSEAPPTPTAPSVDLISLGAGRASMTTEKAPGDAPSLNPTSMPIVTGASTTVTTPAASVRKTAAAPRVHLPALDLHVNGPTSDRVYKAAVYRQGDTAADQSLLGKPSATGVFEIEVNPEHPVFQSSSFQLADAVLAEFAHHVANEENARGSSTRVGFSELLSSLRTQYRADTSLDPNRLTLDLAELLGRVQGKLTEALTPDEQATLLTQLSPDSVKRIQLAQARGAGRKVVSALINIEDLALLFRSCTALIMRSGCFKGTWEPAELVMDPALLALYQDEFRRRIGGVLDSLASFAPRQEEHGSPAMLFYVRAAIDLLRELLA